MSVCVYSVLSIGKGLATGSSPAQDPTKDCRAIDRFGNAVCKYTVSNDNN
jgi:hypothetical protein